MTPATRCSRSRTRPRASSTRTRRSWRARRSASPSRSTPCRPTWSRRRPPCCTATPRLLERVRGDIELRMGHAGRVKRGAYRWAMGQADEGGGCPDRRTARRHPGRLARPAARRGLRQAPGRPPPCPLRRHRRLVRGSGLAALVLGARRPVPRAVRPGRDRRHRHDPARRARPRHGRHTARRRDRGPPRRGGAPRAQGRGSPSGTLDGSPVTSDDGWYDTGDLATIDAAGRVVPIGRRAHVLRTASGERGVTGGDRERAEGVPVRAERDGRRRRPARSSPR